MKKFPCTNTTKMIKRNIYLFIFKGENVFMLNLIKMIKKQLFLLFQYKMIFIQDRIIKLCINNR